MRKTIGYFFPKTIIISVHKSPNSHWIQNGIFVAEYLVSNYFWLENIKIICTIIYKLEGVGPNDTRPSTD